MRKPRLRTALIGTGAALALVAGGTAAGAAAFASSGTVYKGCIEGTGRIMGHVYTRTNPPACPHGSFAATWNQAGQQGPSGVVSMAQYAISGGSPAAAGNWQFLGTPPVENFTDAKTGAQVTGTIDLESTDGNKNSGDLGICYEPAGGSTLTSVGFVIPEFATPAGSFFAQTVSGVVGNLTPGQYNVGLCAEAQSTNTANGHGQVSILMAETASGVSSAGPRLGAAPQNHPNR